MEELQAYMGFMILTGLIKLSSIYDYWKKGETYHYSSVASRTMRDRFFKFHRSVRSMVGDIRNTRDRVQLLV